MEPMTFHALADWEAWLADHHETAGEAWLAIAKKGSPTPTITATEAGDVAICFGWIDSQRRGLDDTHFLQRYSPRRNGARWSQVNVDRAEALIAAGRMRPAGFAQIAAAKVDGRWAAAYPAQRDAKTPEDLEAALAGRPSRRGGAVRRPRQDQPLRRHPQADQRAQPGRPHQAVGGADRPAGQRSAHPATAGRVTGHTAWAAVRR